MATSTSNLGLTLPSVNDAADIAVLNSNFQKIDGKIPAAGAAPSGYGLGVACQYIDSWNNAIKPGYYVAYTDSPNGSTWYGQVMANSAFNQNTDTQIVQRIYNNKSWSGNMVCCERISKDLGATWQPWEWVNPPMVLGVEYRTTKRYDGHVVYTQMISCGKGPASGGANYYLNLNTNNIIFTQIRCKAVSPTSYWGAFLDQYIMYGEYGSGAPCVSLSANAGDQSNRNIYLIVEYYKV